MAYEDGSAESEYYENVLRPQEREITEKFRGDTIARLSSSVEQAERNAGVVRVAGDLSNEGGSPADLPTWGELQEMMAEVIASSKRTSENLSEAVRLLLGY